MCSCSKHSTTEALGNASSNAESLVKAIQHETMTRWKTRLRKVSAKDAHAGFDAKERATQIQIQTITIFAWYATTSQSWLKTFRKRHRHAEIITYLILKIYHDGLRLRTAVNNIGAFDDVWHDDSIMRHINYCDTSLMPSGCPTLTLKIKCN